MYHCSLTSSWVVAFFTFVSVDLDAQVAVACGIQDGVALVLSTVVLGNVQHCRHINHGRVVFNHDRRTIGERHVIGLAPHGYTPIQEDQSATGGKNDAHFVWLYELNYLQFYFFVVAVCNFLLAPLHHECTTVHFVVVRIPYTCTAPHHLPLGGGAVVQWCGPQGE